MSLNLKQSAVTFIGEHRGCDIEVLAERDGYSVSVSCSPPPHRASVFVSDQQTAYKVAEMLANTFADATGYGEVRQ